MIMKIIASILFILAIRSEIVITEYFYLTIGTIWWVGSVIIDKLDDTSEDLEEVKK